MRASFSGIIVPLFFNEKTLSRHFTLITLPHHDQLSDEPYAASKLRSNKTYTCVKHPQKQAFCLCAKCGSLLCDSCCMLVGGRHYCMPCIEHDDALMMTLESEVFHPSEKAEESKETVCPAPQRLSEIPRGLLSMCMDSSTFFKTAFESPFALTFFLALIAVVPTKIGEAMRVEEMRATAEKLFSDVPALMQSYEILVETPVGMRCAGGCISAVIQILLLDLLLFACIRGISHCKLSFGQVGSLLHYCMFPLILAGIGTIYNVPVVSFVGLCLMIVILTTAVRVSTKCSFGQGVLIMLIFILMSNITGLLRFYGI